MIRIFIAFVFLSSALFVSCQAPKSMQLGSEDFDRYLPLLEGKRVALFVNNTSLMTDRTHVVDALLSRKVNVQKIFAPEHGFRGNAADGEEFGDGKDIKTGLAITSLYGKNRKATPEQMADIDVVIFDIQDVGTRFYTYISSMHYMMESCAENNKTMIILDRPNPNAFVDGPMLQPEQRGFVGMHPIPITHGMTIGELAMMINGQGWLEGGLKCSLEVIPLHHYVHGDEVKMLVPPSPNLPNDHAVAMYPYICLFEGTSLSLGRGTPFPFEVLGHPDLKNQPFEFTPVTITGVALNPPQENKLCHGIDLRGENPPRKIYLKHLIDMYNQFPDKEKFFIPYIDRLAGTPLLKEQIKKGMTEEEIRATWQPDLDAYKKIRSKYLLYADR